MIETRSDDLLDAGERPVLVVGDDEEVRERLGHVLKAVRSSDAVIAAHPSEAPVPGEDAEVAGVVYLTPPDGGTFPWDELAAPRATDGGPAGERAVPLLSAAVDADRCPVVVVGPDVDAAAAYEAGATEVVPLSVADHAEAVAEQIAETVDRHLDRGLAGDLLDETNDGMVVHDPETAEIVEANDRFYEMLGYDPETADVRLDDLTGHGEFTTDRAVSRIRDAADGSPSTFEWKDPTNDGSDLWVEVNVEAATLAGERYVVSSVRDINDRKERNRELEASRERLRRLQEITSDPDSDFDKQLQSLFEFGAEQLGVDIAYLGEVDEEGERFRVAHAYGDHPLLRAGAESDLAETYCRWTVDSIGEATYATESAEEADGVRNAAYERWGLECYLGARITVDGSLYGTLCFADDDPRTEPFSETERALVEYMAQWLEQELERRTYIEEVETAGRRLEDTFERVADAFFGVDEEWRIQYANEAGAEVLRQAMGEEYDDEELIGKILWKEIPEVADTEFYDRYHEAMRTQEPVTFEERYEPMDTWFEVRAYPDPDGLSVYFSDVTDRKERERELYILERAIQEASIPIVMADPHEPDAPLVFVNEAFEELTGYDASEAVGRNCRFLQGPDTDPESVAELREAIENEETLVTEILNYTADGRPFWNRIELTPIYDEDGELLRYLGSQYDVTERRRNREVRRQLLATTRDLMDASTPGEIASIVSDAAVEVLEHDLNAVYLFEDEEPTGRPEPTVVSEAVTESPADLAAGADRGLLRRALDEGEPVVVDDVAEHEDVPTAAVAPVRSLLFLPLGERGVLVVGSGDVSSFDAAETDRAELLTTNAGRALDRTERRAELERYETLFETVQDKLYVADADGYVEMVSEPLADAVGKPPADIVGDHLSEFVTEDTVAEGQGLVFDLLVTPDATSSVYEGALRHVDGTERPVEIEMSLLPYDDGFRGTVGAVRDISERRRREEELDVFQRAIDEAGIGVAVYDRNGRFEYVNEHYAQTLGTTREALERTPVWEVVSDIDADAFDAFWSSFAPDETRTNETEHRRTDGSTLPVETVTTAVEIDGERHHVVTVREITGRRERRQQSEVLHRIIRHNLRNDLSVILGHADILTSTLDGDAADSAATILETAEDLRGLTGAATDAADLIGGDIVRKPIDAVEVLREEVDRIRADSDATVRTDLPEERYVLADTPLKMAFHQLLANAVEHNDAEAIEIGVRVSSASDRTGWCTIEITDNGPGIPEYELNVLTAGEETSLKHGSGVGLWIVYWAVTRYGGELDFEESPSGGSTVRIELPVADPPENR
ncbi:PAS domain S-box protein [Halorubrum sp. GN11_10-6_MGM]|uniref:PAS domain S-box protein n=1 Tax=Halorubrum sp. GN11_10-6_MGM TaxID=2518112 RepID=UPI0010F9E68E|nr:PAS domain S-box protein [Halorubrum sp. GN11_10-6_MGM]TKX75506.1 PAS domain S-box protein [Halorubrum sp. GN11_10-6_MGM]